MFKLSNIWAKRAVCTTGIKFKTHYNNQANKPKFYPFNRPDGLEGKKEPKLWADPMDAYRVGIKIYRDQDI